MLIQNSNILKSHDLYISIYIMNPVLEICIVILGVYLCSRAFTLIANFMGLKSTDYSIYLLWGLALVVFWIFLERDREMKSPFFLT